MTVLEKLKTRVVVDGITFNIHHQYRDTRWCGVVASNGVVSQEFMVKPDLPVSELPAALRKNLVGAQQWYAGQVKSSQGALDLGNAMMSSFFKEEE